MEPINDPQYWSARLRGSKYLHQSIFICSLTKWRYVEEKHRLILSNILRPDDSILDVGCGYGRLLSLLPSWWRGYYHGVDLCPDFIELAKKSYPHHNFTVANISNMEFDLGISKVKYDYGILISMKYMIIRNVGQSYWDEIEKKLRIVTKKLLLLEYDEEDSGTVQDFEKNEN